MQFCLTQVAIQKQGDLKSQRWAAILGSAQTQKELEGYRLQEQEEDPVRIEREPDLPKEQEEYFRRIRQDWMDHGSSE